ncbi:GNAT family N-acetyltransferase [Elioraea sp. Yellowstone]|jgi:predicted GNAT superfamily acetyltransferase|uniref:GNAT family N-acetyltransferase n=1 Tax=Elioraea sp. Yellowstone TaxID=2592070 RepID=UPI00114E9231|nr:GNAT family N-acetyltransferase [Elioraea sp. Yellowstone]TQF83151.1 GNAT family N-acetyltransferase [Elioraea sp. Yellowstone]
MTPIPPIRPIHSGDLDAVLRLNRAHEVELSSLTRDRLAALTGMAFAAWVVPPAEAFLIAFDQDTAYDSSNFRWFKERFERFVYVDRIVVAASARGRGLARALYARIFAEARACGHDAVVAEVNSDPPNPASDAFHAALGFAPIGSAALADRGKTVTYLVKRLA